MAWQSRFSLPRRIQKEIATHGKIRHARDDKKKTPSP